MGAFESSNAPLNTFSGNFDTNFTSLGDLEVPQYDLASGKWLNVTLSEAGISAVGHTHLLAAGATDVTATAAELNFVSGVTSAIQTQLDTKLFNNTDDVFTGNLDIVGTAGVGIARTDGTLHVHTASAGGVAPSASFDDLVVENSSNVGFSMFCPDASFSSFVFGSPSDSNGALIQFQQSAALLTMGSQLAGGEVAFQSANNVEAMRIDSSQNVGIGEATPLHRLDVRVSATGAIPTDHQIGVANANNNYIGFMNESDTATYSGFALQTRTTSASRWLIANEWQSATQGDLVFRARDNATSNEIVRFKYDGKIGVGTPTPAELLEISLDDRVNGAVFRITNAASSSSWIAGDIVGDIDFNIDDPSAAGVRSRIRSVSTAGATAPSAVDLTFSTYASAALSEAMRIDSVGDLLLGLTASNDGKFHIDQASTTGAKPVLTLDQADVSEEFIKFTGVEAVGNVVEDVGAKTLTPLKFVRININGTYYMMQAGSIA